MQRTVIGWLGAGVSVSALFVAGALAACSSSKASGSAGTSTGTGGQAATATSSGETASSSGATTSTATTGSTTGTASTSSSSGATTPGDSVLTHHKNPNRDGLYIEAALTKAAVTAGLNKDPTFNPSLPDPNDLVYAQPLFVDGGTGGTDMVIVATEANNVYAFDAATGATLWHTNLGAPVPLSMMNCGNIDPFGVTGTPVIDFASRTLFATALVLPSGGPQKHEIFALDIDTGTPKSGWPVDVGALTAPGGQKFTVGTQGSRGALLIVDGTLYAPFGGLYGDCNPYYGWVVAVPLDDPTKVKSWATTLKGGGVWSPGGISTDGTDLYVATGNTFNEMGNVWGGGDATIRLGTGTAFGAPLSYNAPTNWPALDNNDLDMGTAPLVFDLAGSTPGSLVLVFGKDGKAYLNDRTNLGGVANALQVMPVATNQIISAPALYTTATATYVAFKGNGSLCTGGTPSGGLATLKIVPGSPPTLAGSWCANAGTGSPMVTTSDGMSDAIVWQLGSEGSNHLEAFDGDTGAAIAFPGSTVTIPNMRRYNTPIAAKGRIFVPADNAVVAFKP